MHRFAPHCVREKSIGFGESRQLCERLWRWSPWAPARSPRSRVEPAFAGKTITIYVGYTAGGSYDLYGRLISRHLGQHLAGRPSVVVQNMPGAGSLKAANYLYEVAPRDGTALGVVVESTALEQALANPAAQYDAAKFTYVGRVATSNNIFMMWQSAKVQSIEDAKLHRPPSWPAPGRARSPRRSPSCSTRFLGTKFKLISGYPASTEAMLAMERGEVDGSSSSWAAVKVGKQDWLKEKKIKIILQTTPERVPELPDAPSLGRDRHHAAGPSRCSPSTRAAARSGDR